MDFFETWNLSLLSSKEHSKNVIMDPSTSEEPTCPPKLQQSVIILQEGSWYLQTWWIFMKLEIYSYWHQRNKSRTLAPVRGFLDTFKHEETWNWSLLPSKENFNDMIKDSSPSQEPPYPPEIQQNVIILQEGSWILIPPNMMDFLWNWKYILIDIKETIQAPVRNIHIFLNSRRVSSFFSRVLDAFKHDIFLWNLNT